MISIWTTSPRCGPHLVTAVTDHAATTSWIQCGGRAGPWQIVGPRHARPQMGAARGSGPAEDGGFDTARRGRQGDIRSGRRNRRLDRTKEQMRARILPCRHDHPSLTVGHPMVGETEHASHTEIRTLPAQVCFPKIVTFDPSVASIPFENIIVSIAPSGAPTSREACLRPHPSGARKTWKVARCHDRLVCGRTAQLVPLCISGGGWTGDLTDASARPISRQGSHFTSVVWTPPRSTIPLLLSAELLNSYPNAMPTTIGTNHPSFGIRAVAVTPGRASALYHRQAA